MANNIDLPREIALKTLYDINEKGAYSNISVNRHLKASKLKEQDRKFLSDLVYGTIKWKLTIDWIIERFSNVKTKKLSPWIFNILRLGVYQLIFMDKTPDSAACDESVKLAKKYGHAVSAKFVNALLRNISRKKDIIEYPNRESDIKKFLSIKYSHPLWMVEKFINLFGTEFTEELLSSNNKAPDFTVRVNTLKASLTSLIKYFNDKDVEAEKGRYIDYALVIKNPSTVLKMNLLKDGYFQIQDESSMLASKVLNPKPGELIMDICSAPGGKAAHVAQLMQNKGTIIARDIHEHKIRLIEEAADRLGAQIIRTEVYDGTIVDNNYIGKADRVLVDAPCTGLGIIRRKPDIKWARSPDDEKQLTELQFAILSAASQYVKPGGILVYSTCTINRAENEDIIKKFIKENGMFKLVDISDEIPSALAKPEARSGYIQLFPNKDYVDGFFISKLMRK